MSTWWTVKELLRANEANINNGKAEKYLSYLRSLRSPVDPDRPAPSFMFDVPSYDYDSLKALFHNPLERHVIDVMIEFTEQESQ